MSRAHFNQIRNTMHTYSRAPIAEGQEFIDQAVARAGHHINFNEVRAEDFPMITSIEERDQYFLTKNINGIRIVGGQYGSKFQKIIQFLDKVSLQEIPMTNGESYRVVDGKGNVIKNFIDPSDKPISEVKLSDGYEVRLIADDGESIINRNYGWDFDPFNGIVHFDSKFKPGSIEWKNKGFGVPTLEGFIYIGKYASEISDNVINSMSKTEQSIQNVIDNSIVIQPFKFSSSVMTPIGEPYQNVINHHNSMKPEWTQQLTFVVPGYCFELTSLDQDQTVLTEMRHLPTGDTQIFLDLPWDKEYSKTIIKYEYDSGIQGVGNRIPVLGDFKFIATTFVKSNGEKIKVRDVIDYESDQIEIITPSDEYSYQFEYDEGWKVPPNCVNTSNYYHRHDCDYDVNVNINN